VLASDVMSVVVAPWFPEESVPHGVDVTRLAYNVLAASNPEVDTRPPTTDIRRSTLVDQLLPNVEERSAAMLPTLVTAKPDDAEVYNDGWPKFKR